MTDGEAGWSLIWVAPTRGRLATEASPGRLEIPRLLLESGMWTAPGRLAIVDVERRIPGSIFARLIAIQPRKFTGQRCHVALSNRPQQKVYGDKIKL